MNFNFRGHMDHIIDIRVPQRGQRNSQVAYEIFSWNFANYFSILAKSRTASIDCRDGCYWRVARFGCQDWLLGLATRVGRQGWQLGLAARVGHQAWPLGLASRVGHQVRLLELATRFGRQGWPLGMATRESRYTQPVRTLFLFKSIWTSPQGSQGC